MKAISIFTEKGGVGKTTLAWSLAASLAERGHRVLAIDLDKQSNLSKLLLGEKTVAELPKLNTVAAALDPHAQIQPEEVLGATKEDRLWIAPSNHYLAEHYLPSESEMTTVQWNLRNLLAALADRFDYAILDTAPGINLLPGWAALLASRFVLTPLEPEPLATGSIQGVGEQIAAARSLQSELRFLGYIVNKLDSRSNLHKGYEASLRRDLGDDVLGTVVRRLKLFAEAQHHKTPVTQYRPKSQEAKLVGELTEEILRRMEVGSGKRTTKRQSRSQSKKRRAA